MKQTEIKYKYYREQLAKVKPGQTEYAPTIKVFANGNGDNTNHMDLNKESAQVLIDWLYSNFCGTKKETI